MVLQVRSQELVTLMSAAILIRVAHTSGQDLVAQFGNSLEELKKAKKPRKIRGVFEWMVWMVHRVLTRPKSQRG